MLYNLKFTTFHGIFKNVYFRLFHFKTDFTDILHYDNTSFKFDIWHCVIKVKVTSSVNVLFIPHQTVRSYNFDTCLEVEIKQLCSSDRLYTFFNRLV